jgi:uncharacterized protein (DUF697 family)
MVERPPAIWVEQPLTEFFYNLISHLYVMSPRVKHFLSVTSALGVLAGLGLFAYWLISKFITYLSAVPKEIGAALIAGVATVFVATLTIVVGKYFERKRELDALYREKKTEIYDEFLKGFFDHYFSGAEESPTQSPEDLVRFLREFTRKLLLWSGPEPIAAFVRWKDHLAKGVPDAQSLFLTEQFILAIRKDLRHSNEGIPKGVFAKLFLREGTLFLALAEKNPNITLAQLAELEKLLVASQERSDG